MTSAPVCAASAAVTELSTPPDMATTIRASPGGRPSWKSSPHLRSLASVFTRISLLSPRPDEGETGTGAVLARHESDFRSDAQEPLSLAELLGLLGDAGQGDGRSREDAIACYLSGERRVG